MCAGFGGGEESGFRGSGLGGVESVRVVGIDRWDAIASEDTRRRRRRALRLEVSRGYLVRLVGARGPGDWDGRYSAPYKRRDKR